MNENSRTIKVDYLARVEGEGTLYIRHTEDQIHEVQLKIFEPPRFFEAFLRERKLEESPDITSRICGICPIAYQMSAVHAMEKALDIQIPPMIRLLRRLLYCGEWIESHVLHIYMLHAPDFLSCEDAVQMSKKNPGILERGLRMKRAGNAIVQIAGGREIHPINVKVGGFYKWPDKLKILSLKEELKWARDAALETVKWTSQFHFPDLNLQYEFVALKHPTEYPMNEGRVVSNQGLDIDISDFEKNFQELQVEHSNALHSQRISDSSSGSNSGSNYFVGPMARWNLNSNLLSPLTKQAAQDVGMKNKENNPFRSIMIRSLEVLYAFDEALRVLDLYSPEGEPAATYKYKKAVGFAATEAPRGLLYHRYEIDSNGKIKAAKIVPPTSQNQWTIEKDLSDFVKNNFKLNAEELQWRCEQAIRNYDPCISCATHFLKIIKQQTQPWAIVGIGNSYRGDDAIGLELTSQLQALLKNKSIKNISNISFFTCESDPLKLLDIFEKFENILIFDAVSDEHLPIGSLVLLDLLTESLSNERTASTHSLGITQTLELAKSMQKLPKNLKFIGLVGQNFNMGENLSNELSENIPLALKEAQKCMNIH